MNLGQRLKDLRLENGLTLRQFSYITGYSHVYISEVEKGVKIPLSNYLVVVAGALLTSYDKLFELAVVSRMDQLAAFLEPKNKRWPEAREILLKGAIQ